MNLFEKMIDRFEIVGRARTLSVLRQQSDRALIDAGFSPELVRVGIKAWPWRTADELATRDNHTAANAVPAQPGFSTSVAATVGQVDVPETSKVANDRIETAA